MLTVRGGRFLKKYFFAGHSSQNWARNSEREKKERNVE
jgi:hypothetical protein